MRIIVFVLAASFVLANSVAALYAGQASFDSLRTAAVKNNPSRRIEIEDTLNLRKGVFESLALPDIDVIRAEEIGGGYAKEILGTQQSTAAQKKLEEFFSETTRQHDTYLILRKNNRYFALAKENPRAQALITIPILDLTNPQNRQEYYAALLEYVSIATTQSGRTIELIEQKGSRLKEYLSLASNSESKEESFSLGTISGTKYWLGSERFFQMEYKSKAASKDARPALITFKKSARPLSRGWSAIVQPKINVMVNGYGTIGAKAALAARKSGFFIAGVTARNVHEKTRDAQDKGYAIYLTDAKNADLFKQEEIVISGALEEILASGKIDTVIDATPNGGDNLKNIYQNFPQVKVIFEGGEKEEIAEVSFASSTNFASAKDKRYVRVVSCNTTAMSRIYGQIAKVYPNLTIDNLAMRRGADPGQEKGANPDAVTGIPASHHGPDLRSVLTEELNKNITKLNTDSTQIPTTHFHFHQGTIRGEGIIVEKIKQILAAQSRVGLVEFEKAEFSTSRLFEIFNSMIPDANHPFIVAVQVIPSSIPGEIKITFAVPQESNVVPENVNALHAMFELMDEAAAIKLVDEAMGIDKIKRGLEKRLPAKLASPLVNISEEDIHLAKTLNVAPEELIEFNEAANEIYQALGSGDFEEYLDKLLEKVKKTSATVPALSSIPASSLKGKRVLIRVDFNVSDEKGNIKSAKRIVEAIPTLLYLIENRATVILTSHNGRPKGKVIPELSLRPVAEELQRLLNEKDHNIKVNFFEQSITEEGLAQGLEDKIIEGAINVLENTRFYLGEEKNKKGEEGYDREFAQGLARLAHNQIYVFNAFGTAERLHASTAGVAEFMENNLLGFLMEKEIKYLQGALDRLYGIIIGGGPKVSEKVPIVKNVIKNIAPGGFIMIGTGPLAAFYKIRYGIELGQKPSEADLRDAEEIMRLAQEKNVEILLPADLVLSDKSLFETAEDGKTYFDLKRLPKGAKIYRLSLDELKQGNRGNLYAYDVGDSSKAIFSDEISKVKAGSSIFWNGTLGVNEMPEFASGSAAVAQSLAQATRNGVITVVGGGDTAKAAEQFAIEDKVTHVSTGGGASAAFLKGESLPVLRFLTELSQAEQAVAAARKALELDGGDDYFVKPTIVGEGANIEPGDSVIFFNFRGDRAEPMFRLLTGDPDFKHFPLENLNLVVAPFAVYNDRYFKEHGFQGVVKESSVTDTLGEVIAENGRTQALIAESEKFKHVTWFFLGLRDVNFSGMDMVQIPSNAIDKHWKMPQMKAAEIGEEAKGWILGESGKPKKDFVLVNFANLDILGHFDNFDAVVDGALVVDKALGVIRRAVKAAGGILVVTADHGSGEQMAKLNELGMPLIGKDGKPVVHKAHAFDHKVPFIIEGAGNVKLKQGGSLKNIAPTILELMGIEKPASMTAESLLEGYSGRAEGPVVVVVRDGWGINKFRNPEAQQYNAVYQAKLRVEREGIQWNDGELTSGNPHTELWAHGSYVGHPDYQMGDSEVGHLNIGAGRQVDSTLSVLNEMLSTEEFSNDEVVQRAVENTKKDGRKLHLVGMLSEGGVHSHLQHLLKLLGVISTHREGLNAVVFHPIFDGRDIETSEKPGWESLAEFEQKVRELGLQDIVRIGVESGRYYAMDRDALNREKRGSPSPELWLERLKPWYDAVVYGEGRHIQSGSPAAALIITEEFLKQPGAIPAIKELSRFNNVIQLALYGDNTEKLKALIANNSIITAKDINELLGILREKDIVPANTLLLMSAQDSGVVNIGELQASIKQIVSTTGIVTLTAAKAVRELLAKDDIPEFELPAELKPSPGTTRNIDELSRIYAEFMDKV